MKLLVKKVDYHSPEYEQVLKIRTKVFIQEQGVPRELELEHEQFSTFYLGSVNQLPVVTGRYREVAENVFKIERVATLVAYRGQGLGKQLMQAMLDDLNKRSDLEREIYLNSQESAVPFYLKLGFKVEGEEFYEAGIKHFKMQF